MQEKVVVPKFKCSSCNNCKQQRCVLLNRYVKEDYNKCFKHSNYITSPIR